jgi:hypothetical protein
MIASTTSPMAIADPLAAVRGTLSAMAARTDRPPLALAPGLTVTDTRGWTPATALASGEALDDFLDTAKQRWRATPHAAAALAWKCYSYWLALPAVLGYAADRRVPLLRPEGVVVRWSTDQPFITIGLTAASASGSASAEVEVAVLPSDPLALGARTTGIRVVADEAALLDELRASLVDDHLALVMAGIRSRLHLGRRTLWGSLAAGVANGLSRAADVIPGPTMDTATQVLTGLGLADLVDLTPHEGGLSVHRKTCCLAFTLPEPKVCAGCCIR